MSAVAEAKKHLGPGHEAKSRAPVDESPEADPVWAAMMDGLSTYIRDHERLYRLLAR